MDYKNAKLLDTPSDSEAKYVESVFVMFSKTLVANSEFLQFYVLDACAGKVYLDCYTLYLTVGFSSNSNIVPIAYAWISADEGTSSWSPFLNLVHRHLPAFYERVTIMADRDKGIAAAIATVFANCMPHQTFCIKHRLKNIARHGLGIRDVYKRIALASTEDALKAIRESAQYANLTDAGRNVIETYDDEVQYLFACCASGRVTYGRSSSQAAESQNSHIASARAQHLVGSILRITDFEARRYDEWAERSLAERLYAPPSIRGRMNEFTDLEKTGPLGTVTTSHSTKRTGSTGEALSTK